MNGDTGGSTLHEMLSWVPVVHGRTDVIIMSASGIGFAILLPLLTLVLMIVVPWVCICIAYHFIGKRWLIWK